MKRNGIISAIATCCICKFSEEGYKKAQELAKTHYKKTGHKVILETTYSTIIGD